LNEKEVPRNATLYRTWRFLLLIQYAIPISFKDRQQQGAADAAHTKGSAYMTRKLAVLLMVLILATTSAFLYYYSKGDGRTSTSGLDLFAGGKNSFDEQKSILATGVDLVDVSSITAEVSVSYADVEEITAHFWGDATLVSGYPIPALTVEMVGTTVKIEVEPRNIMGFRMLFSDLNLDVTLPYSYAADLKVASVSGAIILDGFTGGSLDIDNVSGRLELGDLELKGSLSANLVSGSIDVDKALAAGSISAKTVSGSIKFGEIWSDTSMKLGTVSGSVRVGIGGDKGFRVSASSVSGQVSCDMPVRIESSTSKKLVGTVGDARSNLDIETVSGSIGINSL